MKVTSVLEENWDFKKSDTRYSTHGIHTWVAAMIPALAKKLIEKTKPTNLLDPFCGGGTVCVEGLLNNIPSAGIDANPLSSIITKTKTRRISESNVNRITDEIIEKAKKSKTSGFFFPDHKEYRTEYWFKKEHIKYLDSIARSISQIENKKNKIFFQCVFSATVRDVSLTYRNEIRLRRLEPKDFEKFDRNVIETFENRVKKTLERTKELPKSGMSRIVTGDVKKLPFKNDEFSTIICSPPYGDERNGVPYFQFVKNMMYWLGLSKSEFEKYKTNVLGWYNKDTIKEKHTPESKTLSKLLKKMDNQKSIDEAVSFYYDYYQGLKEMSRVTTDKIVIVIGNRILNKQVINNAAVTTELFSNIGVKLSEHHKRDLPSKRIPRFGDVKKIEGGQIDKEDILIYSV